MFGSSFPAQATPAAKDMLITKNKIPDLLPLLAVFKTLSREMKLITGYYNIETIGSQAQAGGGTGYSSFYCFSHYK
jgi:hypothetical protein